ncbi:CDP-alcohol phosphatidyltransferase family protein [Alkalimarinus coralli]|uniref:CDP-alcohol phosphatidyltransferase family protein n=1 Tax=Alkalimarinus coralli TaxID=2935863 RepID=UPI00202B3A37|nr:CDP-alcohol phosphatidyltransferase family protein [Alkalimarinus coralli]
MKKPLLIVSLNPVDWLTLSGVWVAAGSLWFAFEHQIAYALSLLYIAMLIDAFDGILARKLGYESEFGRYLDSFVDVLDYLIVPGFILYFWGFNGVFEGMLIILVLCCGILRLSVFNQSGNVKDENGNLAYLGMPVFWLNFILGGAYILSWFIGLAIVMALLCVIYPVACFLMIYNGPFFKFSSINVIVSLVFGGALVFFLAGLFG